MSATSIPPITLMSNFDPTKVVMKSIKCTTGEDIGYSHKVDFPRFEGREEDPIEEMLTFCRDFFDGISQFTFKDEHKRPLEAIMISSTLCFSAMPRVDGDYVSMRRPAHKTDAPSRHSVEQ